MQGDGPYINSPVLNELHRYFPALLYNNGEFNTVADVMGYVRNQMHARFDVYSNQRSQYLSSNYIPTPSRAARPVHPNIRRPAPAAPNMNPIDLANNIIISDALNNELNRILFSGMGIGFHPPVGFMEPVVVAPSAEQIAAGSVLQVALAELENPCTVCQDVIAEGDELRRLTHCNHAFHKYCIDRWYQRNVHCPVCRHDIRVIEAAESPV